MPIGAYTPVGDRPEGGCRPGAAALHEYIIERWGEGVGSFGCYNPNSRAGDGWSLHREGRAIDVSIASAVKDKGDDIFHWAIRNADPLGLQEIQWSGQIWTSRRNQEGIRPDTSPAGKLHYDHVHIGLADGRTFTPPDLSGKGGDDLTPEESRQLKAVYDAVFDHANGMQNRLSRIENTTAPVWVAILDSQNGMQDRLVRVENGVNSIKAAVFDGAMSLSGLIGDTWRRVANAKIGDSPEDV